MSQLDDLNRNAQARFAERPGASVIRGDAHALLRALETLNREARQLRAEGWTVHLLPSDAVDGPVRATLSKDTLPPDPMAEQKAFMDMINTGKR